MGIELELHSGRPTRKGASRDTLLRSSYEHGEALASVLSTLDLTPRSVATDLIAAPGLKRYNTTASALNSAG